MSDYENYYYWSCNNYLFISRSEYVLYVISIRTETIMLKEWVWSINHRHAERECMICSTSMSLFEFEARTYKPVFHRYLPIGVVMFIARTDT